MDMCCPIKPSSKSDDSKRTFIVIYKMAHWHPKCIRLPGKRLLINDCLNCGEMSICPSLCEQDGKSTLINQSCKLIPQRLISVDSFGPRGVFMVCYACSGDCIQQYL